MPQYILSILSLFSIIITHKLGGELFILLAFKYQQAVIYSKNRDLPPRYLKNDAD